MRFRSVSTLRRLVVGHRYARTQAAALRYFSRSGDGPRRDRCRVAQIRNAAERSKRLLATHGIASADLAEIGCGRGVITGWGAEVDWGGPARGAEDPMTAARTALVEPLPKREADDFLGSVFWALSRGDAASADGSRCRAADRRRPARAPCRVVASPQRLPRATLWETARARRLDG